MFIHGSGVLQSLNSLFSPPSRQLLRDRLHFTALDCCKILHIFLYIDLPAVTCSLLRPGPARPCLCLQYNKATFIIGCGSYRSPTDDHHQDTQQFCRSDLFVPCPCLWLQCTGQYSSVRCCSALYTAVQLFTVHYSSVHCTVGCGDLKKIFEKFPVSFALFSVFHIYRHKSFRL